MSELLAAESRQVLRRKVGEDPVEVGADVAPVAEGRRAGDVHRPEVAGPGVDVAEQVPVERLEVGDVVGAGQRMNLEQFGPSERKVRRGGWSRSASDKPSRLTRTPVSGLT